MFAQILPEGLGLFHYLVVDRRGVEEMEQAVLAPHGKAEVGIVEPVFARDDGHEVAVARASPDFSR